MIFSTTGLPLQGITGGFGVDRRVEFIIPEQGRKSGVYSFYVEASCVSVCGKSSGVVGRRVGKKGS
jgi:alpha-mannosidase